MFKTRLISGIVVAVCMLGLTWLGGIYLIAGLAVASVIGTYEFYRATGILPEGKRITPNTGAGYCFTVLYYLFLYFSENKMFFIIYM